MSSKIIFLFLVGLITVHAIKKFKKDQNLESRLANMPTKRRKKKIKRCKKNLKKYPMSRKCSRLIGKPISNSPTVTPTSSPTTTPTQFPSTYPSSTPSKSPSGSPTIHPSFLPSISNLPSASFYPSTSPTESLGPSYHPSVSKNPSLSFAPSATIHLLHFDDLLANPEIEVPEGYFNLTYENLYAIDQSILSYPNNGFNEGMISSPNVVYNGRSKPAKISSNYTFSIHSLWCTPAWEGDLEVTFKGSIRDSGAEVIYVLNMAATNHTEFVQFLGFEQLSTFKIITKPSSQVVLDDISFSHH